MTIPKCKYCKKGFHYKHNVIRLFCSKACYLKFVEKPLSTCLTCSKIFKSKWQTTQKFCSRKCMRIQRRKEKIKLDIVKCPVCKKIFEGKRWLKRKFCSRDCYFEYQSKKYNLPKCHPERKRSIRGLCRPCYSNKLGKERYRKKKRYIQDRLCIKKYNLTLKEKRELIKKQDSKCKICKNIVKKLCIDHCHKTKRVRGLLCHNCNRGLGHFKDDTNIIQKSIEYLQKEKINIQKFNYLKFNNTRKRNKLIKSNCCICDDNGTDFDHNHSTGYIRGVLCNHCNAGIGQFKDNPKYLLKAKKYLEVYLG